MNLRLAISFILLPAILLCCGRTELDTPPDTGGDQPGKVPSSFTAFAPSGKAYIDSNLWLNWEDDDRIWVDGEEFTLSEKNGSSAVFSGLVDPDREKNLAFFPYDELHSLSSTSAILPTIQTARKGGCPWPLCYAVSEGQTLHFRHLDAALQFTLGSDMGALEQVSLRGNNGEILSGRQKLSFADGILAGTMVDAPGKTIVLKGPFEAGATYCFNILGLGITFTKGLTMDFRFSDGVSGSLSSDKKFTISAGDWMNLCDNVTRAEVTLGSGGIASLADWREFKAALEAGDDISAWCRGGEVFLKGDIDGVTSTDVLPSLKIPLNGHGHTITMDVVGTDTNCGLIGELAAPVHDLNLAGLLDYGGTGRVGALAGTVSAPVSITNVSSSVGVRCYNTGNNSTTLVAGLVGNTTFKSGNCIFKNCSVTGEVRAIQHVYALGGIIASGGSGSSPEVLLDGCSFEGTIEYGQSSAAVSSSGSDRGAGRIGGLIGDASRIVILRGCSTTADACINVRLNGWSLGAGGIGGLVGRSTKSVDGYTMRVSFEGENVNRAAIRVWDIPEDQKTRCGQVLGSEVQAPVGAGAGEGSLDFLSSKAPGSMGGSFSLCQVSGRKVSGKKGLDGVTRTVGTNYMSYFMVTSGGKIMVLDGGYAQDVPTLKGLIKKYGGHVDKWFLSHPHGDHYSALLALLKDMDGVTIGEIIYSRCKGISNELYTALDALSGGIKVTDIQTPGIRLDIDGVGIKVLSIADPHLHSNLNNSSMVLRIWDRDKTVVFLGDAGVPLGHKLISDYKADLDCDYLQLGHHGNFGCDEYFYRTVRFSWALVPTALWIWHPELFHKTMPSNLDGGLTRSWIESILPADHIITSYDYTDWWVAGSGTAVVDGYNAIATSPYFAMGGGRLDSLSGTYNYVFPFPDIRERFLCFL